MNLTTCIPIVKITTRPAMAALLSSFLSSSSSSSWPTHLKIRTGICPQIGSAMVDFSMAETNLGQRSCGWRPWISTISGFDCNHRIAHPVLLPDLPHQTRFPMKKMEK